MQEALTRISSGTVHYSSAHTLNSTEQPLFAATARALCQLAAPYTISCYRRIYPETSARPDTEQALKGLKELIQSWDQERFQASGELATTCGVGACMYKLKTGNVNSMYKQEPVTSHTQVRWLCFHAYCLSRTSQVGMVCLRC